MKKYVEEYEKCYEALVESAAENDDELLEKFFGGEELTADEIKLGLRKGIALGSTIPVLGGSATTSSVASTSFVRVICAMRPCAW